MGFHKPGPTDAATVLAPEAIGHAVDVFAKIGALILLATRVSKEERLKITANADANALFASVTTFLYNHKLNDLTKVHVLSSYIGTTIKMPLSALFPL